MKETSIYEGTILKNCKRKIEMFVMIMKGLFFSMQIKGLAEQKNYDSRNLKKKSKADAKKYYQSIPMIGGEDIIVEVSGSNFGKGSIIEDILFIVSE